VRPIPYFVPMEDQESLEKAIFRAISHENITELQTLLSQNPNFDLNDNGSAARPKKTALHQACELGSLGIVDYLLVTGASLDCRELQRNDTPLHIAARNGRSEVIQGLLKAVKDPPSRKIYMDSTNKLGLTALHVAADGGKSKVVQTLIEELTDILDRKRYLYLLTKGKWTPLHWL
jgi:ankyrin repeat protein